MTDGGAVTVGSLFQEIMGRRAGLIKALTTDAEEFYMKCDPKKENLCLYGFPDGRWELQSAPDMVPPDHPEPALGINFARDKMQRNHWLSFVAMKSNPWIISVAFYFGAGYGFNKADREYLFDMINDLPTIVEIVTGAMPNNDNGVELLTDRGKFSVEDVFGNFKRRQAGLIKALTTDVKKFYKLCDPNKENLWLFGYSDGRWEVDIPREEIPAEYPEPVLGINFCRDEMQQKDWLSFVARHSDAWIISLAFSFGAKFGFEKADRKRLFNMINDLPTIVEVVTGAVPENEEVGIMEVDDQEAEHEETLYAPLKFGVFSVEDVFGNFKRRQAGLIKALTTDVEKFYKLCDPNKENLCLFAYSDGRWEVDMPPDMVPASHPEPVQGINFCRDTMPYGKWLSLIAAFSDAWIISVAFSLGAEFGFGKAHRQRLFDMINDLPTISEVVTHEILYGVRHKIEISSDEEVDSESVSSASEDEEDNSESVSSNDSKSEGEEDDSEYSESESSNDSEWADEEDDSEAESSDDSD